MQIGRCSLLVCLTFFGNVALSGDRASEANCTASLAGDSYEYAVTSRSRESVIRDGGYDANDLDVHSLQGKRVLDIGSGNGNFVREMKALGVDIYGVDKERRTAPDTCPTCYMADARRTPFADSNFDVGFSTWSLFWFADRAVQAEAFREIIRIFKNGAKIHLGPADPIQVADILKAMPQLRIEKVYLGRSITLVKIDENAQAIPIRFINNDSGRSMLELSILHPDLAAYYTSPDSQLAALDPSKAATKELLLRLLADSNPRLRASIASYLKGSGRSYLENRDITIFEYFLKASSLTHYQDYGTLQTSIVDHYWDDPKIRSLFKEPLPPLNRLFESKQDVIHAAYIKFIRTLKAHLDENGRLD